jgi:signal transduction histidine kinase
VQVESDAEVHRLRAVLRDLVALSAIPAAWIGSDPPVVAAGLADTLMDLLQLDFAFVRLSDPGGAAAVEVTRGSTWTAFAEWRQGHLAASAPLPRKEIVPDIGGSERRHGFAVPVGVNGEGGVVAAASERSDFPTPMDELLLSLAANHAAAAFQSARLIHERKRAEEELRRARNDLEVKVAERTAELGLLADEQAALRRMATLVAEGVPPVQIFSAVSDEVGRLIGSDMAAVVRFEHHPPAIVVVGVGRSIPGIPIGTRSELDDGLASTQVYRTGRPARVDERDWASSTGPLHEPARRLSLSSTVASPINVDGRLWGTISVSAKEPLPLGTEGRLEKWSELLATALANAESREALARLADEQAALRRVATLVAQGVRPADIFSAVSQEVHHLFGLAGETLDVATVVRFDPGPEFVLVGAAKSIEGLPLGSRWGPRDLHVSTRVLRTGCSARVDERELVSVGGPEAETLRRQGLICQVASPIVVEGRLWGAATVNAKEELPPDTEERLEKFTELVATAIANAEGKSELAASRRRIVAASDETRRRIERDLHDGTQQRLVSLGLAVRSAEANVPTERDDLRMELSTVATGLAAAATELQELSRGIHPAILSQGGLGPALRTLARRSPIRVELEVTVHMRLPEPIEVAAYYVASESLANAVKHARASRIEASLGRRNRSLELSIRDDGIGGADPSRGSGLVGLTDRVEAVGGSIRVESRRGEGTHVTAELPLELEVVDES